jgi:polar amino acid transport system substrate-binding protein
MNKLILAAVAVAALTFGANAAGVKIGTEGAYPPYNFVDDNGKVGGYDIEVGNEMCKRAQVECTWVVNEWDTIIPNLIAGNYDGIMADMSITDERKKTINFTDAYFPPDPSTYVSLAGKTFDYNALKGLKIGAQVATIQIDYLNKNLKADTDLTAKFNTALQAMKDDGTLDGLIAKFFPEKKGGPFYKK